MSIHRVASLASTCAFALGVAHAAPVVATQYPLQVHLVSGGGSGTPRHGWRGQGVGNVVDGDQIHGMLYRSHCAKPLAASKPGEDYAGRWTKPGQTLEVALGETTCELQVSLKDALYLRERGRVRAVSYSEYNKATGGKWVQTKALNPREKDPAYYPLELDVMAVRWREGASTPVGNGQGNLKTERGPVAVDFSITCPTKLEVLPDGQYYRARWRREHYEMTLLVEAGDASSVCVLNATTTPAVYVRQAGGTLQAVPLALYRRLLTDDANVTSRY